MCGPHQEGVRREGRLAVHTTQEIPGLVTLAGSLWLPPSAASLPRIQIQSQNTTARATLRYLPSYVHSENKQQALPQCVMEANYYCK